MTTTQPHADERRLPMWHEALLYRSRDEYVDGLTAFLHEAIADERPAFVSVPAEHGDLLRASLDGQSHLVRFADMRQVGANPNRILPAIRAFIDEHADREVSFIGEPIWAGRSEAEVAEATRHEALINHAFDGTGARIICPYDVSALDPRTVADAYRTHPRVWADGAWVTSADYTDPTFLWCTIKHLPPVPAEAETFEVETDDLPRLRARADAHADDAKLDLARSQDLALVVSELASNSLNHAGHPGTVALWHEDGTVWAQVTDRGRITDPLAGRVQPDRTSWGGRGLWLVNNLSDLVQLHSDETGTVIRVRISRPS